VLAVLPAVPPVRNCSGFHQFSGNGLRLQWRPCCRCVEPIASLHE
jgi:hypothetical protein